MRRCERVAAVALLEDGFPRDLVVDGVAHRLRVARLLRGFEGRVCKARHLLNPAALVGRTRAIFFVVGQGVDATVGAQKPQAGTAHPKAIGRARAAAFFAAVGAAVVAPPQARRAPLRRLDVAQSAGTAVGGGVRRAVPPVAAVAVIVEDADAVDVFVAVVEGVGLGRLSSRVFAIADSIVHRNWAQVGGAVLAHARHIVVLGHGAKLIVIRPPGEGAVALVEARPSVRTAVHSLQPDTVAVGNLVAQRLGLEHVCNRNARGTRTTVQSVHTVGDAGAAECNIALVHGVRREPALLDHRAVDLVRIVFKGMRCEPALRRVRRQRRRRRRWAWRRRAKEEVARVARAVGVAIAAVGEAEPDAAVRRPRTVKLCAVVSARRKFGAPDATWNVPWFRRVEGILEIGAAYDGRAVVW